MSGPGCDRRQCLLALVRERGRPLPGWAAEIGCANWAQVFLKFIVSHPAVTCAIPCAGVDHSLSWVNKPPDIGPVRPTLLKGATRRAETTLSSISM